MSRPPIWIVNHQPIRHNSLHLKKIISIIEENLKEDYVPPTECNPVLPKESKQQLFCCIDIRKSLGDCRDKNPEYNCKHLEECLYKFKCLNK